MPNLTKHDLEFRPLTYWGPVELETHLLSTIKGEVRRQYVKFLSREGKPDEVDASVAKSSLSESERSAVGRIHPAFMGGEYLPDLQDTEVEIARIVYNSTMLDVISIRARRAGKRIAYSIVDEYENEYADERYECHPKTSKRPLTLR